MHHSRLTSLLLLILFPFILEFRTPQTQLSSDDFNPVWSPDSQEIVFASRRLGGGIFIVDINTQTIHLVTDKGAIYTNWSPDGTHLVFSSGVIGNLSLYSVNIEGNDLRLLVSDSYNNIRPIWSPDGKSIAFQSNQDQSSVFVMNADGTNIRKIVDEATIGETIFTPYDDNVNI
jgi:TolB protein